MKVWSIGPRFFLCLLALLILIPTQGHAIPAFARKFGVKCYTCHTVPPALNKNGYMFKRLGYRMPPDEMDGTKPAPKVHSLDNNIPFRITNVLALILQGSYDVEKTKADAGNTTSASPASSCNSGNDGSQQNSSCSSFNLDEAALFLAGTVPNTGISYFGHSELYQGGANDLEQGFGVYTGGRANNSYFVKAGEMHMQEGEGTRAAMFYNLFPDHAYTLSNGNPGNVVASRQATRRLTVPYEPGFYFSVRQSLQEPPGVHVPCLYVNAHDPSGFFRYAPLRHCRRPRPRQ